MFRHTHKLISLTVLTLLLSETNANVLASDTKIEQKLQNQVDQKTILDVERHKKHADNDLVQTDQKENSKGSSEQSHRRKHKRRHRHNSHKKHNKKKQKKDNFDKEPHTVSNKDDKDMSVKKAAEIEINKEKMKSLAQKPNEGKKPDNFDHDPTTVSEKDDKVKDLPNKAAKQAQVPQTKLSLVQVTEKKKEDSPAKEKSKEQKLVEVKQDKKQEKKESKTQAKEQTKKSENKVEQKVIKNETKPQEIKIAQNSTIKIEDQGIGAKTALRIIEGKAATPISLPPNPIVQTKEALAQVFKGQDFTEGEDLISSFIVDTDPHKPREVNSWLNNNIEKNQEEE